MSKLGRYSADRKKIESVTGTSKTIAVADCGTAFIMATPGASGACTYTLPAPATAGKGWWCKFIVNIDHDDADHVVLGVAADIQVAAS